MPHASNKGLSFKVPGILGTIAVFTAFINNVSDILETLFSLIGGVLLPFCLSMVCVGWCVWILLRKTEEEGKDILLDQHDEREKKGKKIPMYSTGTRVKVGIALILFLGISIYLGYGAYQKLRPLPLRIHGYVYDISGNAIEGAIIRLFRSKTGPDINQGEVYTDSCGFYELIIKGGTGPLIYLYLKVYRPKCPSDPIELPLLKERKTDEHLCKSNEDLNSPIIFFHKIKPCK